MSIKYGIWLIKNRLQTICNKISSKISNKIINITLRHSKRYLQRVDSYEEFQEIQQEMKDNFFIAYAKEKELKSHKVDLLKLHPSPYKDVHANIETALEGIEPNIAVTLNFNPNKPGAMSIKQANKKLELFINECQRRYGKIKGYATFEHIQSNIHAHLALHLPKKWITNEDLYILENDMNISWKMYVKSGNVYVRGISGSGWFWYMAKNVKDYSYLIPII